MEQPPTKQRIHINSLPSLALEAIFANQPLPDQAINLEVCRHWMSIQEREMRSRRSLVDISPSNLKILARFPNVTKLSVHVQVYSVYLLEALVQLTSLRELTLDCANSRLGFEIEPRVEYYRSSAGFTLPCIDTVKCLKLNVQLSSHQFLDSFQLLSVFPCINWIHITNENDFCRSCGILLDNRARLACLHAMANKLKGQFAELKGGEVHSHVSRLPCEKLSFEKW